jgi:hypothetical protein
VDPPLIPGLGEELTAAAGRLHRRRRRRLQLATAGAMAVVFVAAMAVTATIDAPPAAAGLEITERNGRIDVRLTDVETRPEVVEHALEDANIDAEVVAAPVSPSLVGRFVSLAATESDLQIEWVDGDGSTAAGFSVPIGFSGHLELTLGRPARNGEGYVAQGSALSAGEPLACSDLLGHPALDLAEIAAEHPNIRFDVRPQGEGGVEPPVPVVELTTGPYANWRILEVKAVAPEAVLVLLTADGQPPSGGVLPPPPTGC